MDIYKIFYLWKIYARHWVSHEGSLMLFLPPFAIYIYSHVWYTVLVSFWKLYYRNYSTQKYKCLFCVQSIVCICMWTGYQRWTAKVEIKVWILLYFVIIYFLLLPGAEGNLVDCEFKAPTYLTALFFIYFFIKMHHNSTNHFFM